MNKNEKVKISIHKIQLFKNRGILKLSEIENKSVVLVDDVLNSGTTLIYGVKHFLNVPLKQFKTAVLVNRNHKKYPVKADFKGLSLSTTLQEHIRIELDGKKMQALLE